MKVHKSPERRHTLYTSEIERHVRVQLLHNREEYLKENGEIDCKVLADAIRDILGKNISNVMKSIDEKDISYRTLRSILDLTLKGIAEIPGNCADDSDHYQPEYELAYCPFCLQMTNHLNNVCQKHKTEK